MKKSVSRITKSPATVNETTPSGHESAVYIRDLLKSLEDIARSQGQINLALFIKAAISEASDLAKQC